MKIIARQRKPFPKKTEHFLKVKVVTTKAIPTFRVKEFVEQAILLRYASKKEIWNTERESYEVIIEER